MNTMPQFIFWFCFAAVFYAYFGYAAMIWLASRFFQKPVMKANVRPRVSVILSAFNEEKWIEEKLLNLLELDYPEDKIEILVGSDGASDKTDEIIARFRCPRVRFYRFVSNMGKPLVINGLVREARGDILVFTDARQRLAADAVTQMVENFADPPVGCVSGELFFEQVRGSGIAGGMDAYWNYEKFLRRCESAVGSMLGMTGAIAAMRKRLYCELPVDILVDDMFLPFAVIEKGDRVVFEGGARAYDIVSSRGREEFRRKVRTLAGNYQVFGLFPSLFHPLKSPVAWQLFSHKFLRLMVPFALALMFAANLFLLDSAFYRAAFAAQAVFYLLAAAEWLWEVFVPGRRWIGYIPYTFCVLNGAALAALVRHCRGARLGAWKKAYE